MVYKILVVGGNGFIGSAVCRAALARGLQVASVSSSGKPYQTAKGHRPGWTDNVEWHKGDALQPQTFAHLFPEVNGVVHTLGILLESDGEKPGYKESVRGGDPLGLVKHLVANAFSGGGASGNPLAKRTSWKGSYEALNRDAALRVCEAFMTSSPTATTIKPRPFVYLSAEDIFRPWIPARYIETKREAEQGISKMMQGRSDYRAVYIRPSLVYHAHYRPLTTPAAVLMDLSNNLHERTPRSMPTPSSILRILGSTITPQQEVHTSSLESMANALSTPPIHVDSVGQVICSVLDEESDVSGVLNVRRMREVIGWGR